mgnify:CR=1 FL=1
MLAWDGEFGKMYRKISCSPYLPLPPCYVFIQLILSVSVALECILSFNSGLLALILKHCSNKHIFVHEMCPHGTFFSLAVGKPDDSTLPHLHSQIQMKRNFIPLLGD